MAERGQHRLEESPWISKTVFFWAVGILTGTIAIFNGKVEAAIERLGDL